jgi:hypothetical protein
VRFGADIIAFPENPSAHFQVAFDDITFFGIGMDMVGERSPGVYFYEKGRIIPLGVVEAVFTPSLSRLISSNVTTKAHWYSSLFSFLILAKDALSPAELQRSGIVEEVFDHCGKSFLFQ